MNATNANKISAKLGEALCRLLGDSPEAKTIIKKAAKGLEPDYYPSITIHVELKPRVEKTLGHGVRSGIVSEIGHDWTRV